MASRDGANVQDVSHMDVDWNSNDMMRDEGEPSVELDSDDDYYEEEGDDDRDRELLEGDDEFGPEDEEGPEDDEDDDEDVDGDIDGDEEPDEMQVEEGEEEEPEDEQDGDQPQPIAPPQNWPQQEQAWFRKLPPQLQHAYMARARHMVADYTKKTQQLAQIKQAYSEFDRVIAPYIDHWAMQGMNPAQAVYNLIGLSNVATKDPVGFIKYFMNLRRITPEQVFGQAQGADGQDPQQGDTNTNPQIVALTRQLAQIQAGLNNSQRQQQVQQQQQVVQQQRAVQNYTMQLIDQFASQTDDNGELVYPHFNELEEDIAIELESGRARSVPEAYQNAMWANPKVRQRMLQQRQVRLNQQERQRTRTARRAMIASGGHAGGSGGRVASDKMSLRQVISAAARGDLA